MFKKILLPTDGSKNSKRAGERAIDIAELTGANIVVLYVVETNYFQSPRLVNYRVNLFDELREEGKKIVEDFRADLEDKKCKGTCQNVDLTTEIKEGNPYSIILETIDKENIDLTVIGASGRHGLDKFLLGSVTERVIRESRSPILVVP